MTYKIKPIREDFLQKVRKDGIDDLKQKVTYLIAKGGEPCRDVLRRARVEEKLILASYCPFKQNGPYKEYGPIFILESESLESINYEQLAISSITKQDYLAQSFVLKAYNNKEQIIDAKVVTKEESQEVLTQLFKNENTHFVLARFTAYGCYALRLEKDDC